MMSSKDFIEAKKYIPGGVNSPVRSFKAVNSSPLFIQKGKGSRIYDGNNKEYIDYCMSYGPLILGHSNPKIISAVKKALDNGTTFGAPTKKETELAKLIADAVPSIEKVRLVNSGTEAVLAALRLARAFTKRNKIIKFEGCYHGHVDDLLVKKNSENTSIVEFNNIKSVKKIIDGKKNKNQIAALIVEPVAGNMGVVLPEDNFLEELREVTEKNNILLIFDEVITGFRVNYGGAQKLYDIRPDLTILGKIIGGGLPVGAFGGRKEIMELLAPDGPVYQAGTLSGNPVTVTAGIETLKILKNKSIYSQLNKKTNELVTNIGNKSIKINQIASMFTIFFNRNKKINNYKTAKQSDTKRFSKFHSALLKNGIYFPPSQFEACFLSMAHSDEDIDRTIKVINDSFSIISQTKYSSKNIPVKNIYK